MRPSPAPWGSVCTPLMLSAPPTLHSLFWVPHRARCPPKPFSSSGVWLCALSATPSVAQPCHPQPHAAQREKGGSCRGKAGAETSRRETTLMHRDLLGVPLGLTGQSLSSFPIAVYPVSRLRLGIASGLSLQRGTDGFSKPGLSPPNHEMGT